ncbi:TonB-dependent receptor [Sphingomonas sp. NSE70-1]|uniref:TonB-dependent receptor n=1 Tax=Sphingomonas caseinilyticus TaxID=2908205 RepID=A0ABT0RWC3_9SPHN|nr:TonB-dependent receptor [Sphingomonas caseinilyticus]MCL6699000.1 TonB-dependent receptor [Sphingomonas caseinilyticus]
MNQYRLVTKAGLLASSAAAAFAFSSPAFAQEAQDAPSMDAQDSGATTGEVAIEEAPAGDEIVVTGTLIRNPNLEQSTPVNVTTSDAIELKQSNVAEEVLRELPGVVPAMGSAVNNGNGGSSFVDLRGLGSIRNIVLLDGNRLVPTGLQGRVDLNNIPLALIERVDALTGAAVTTYGADAITGVVNFITRRDFAGLELAASEQITEKGDGNYLRADLTLGANFDDGRGNAVVSFGYQQSDPVYQGERDFSVFQVSSYSGGQSGSGTAVPSRFSGLRSIDPATCALVPNTPDTGNRGVSQIEWRDGQACRGGSIANNYAPFNFNPYNIFQTPFTRYNIFGQANYEVSDAVEVYGRGLFSKNNVKTIIAPSGSFGGSIPINLNNPFLPATLRNQFCAFDVNPSPAAYQARFTQAECDAAALATGPSDPRYRVIGQGGVFTPYDVNGDGVIGRHPITQAIIEGFNTNPAVAFNRRTTESGPRISEFQATTFDSRIGLRGPLTSTVDWDVSGSYGVAENIQDIQGYTLQSRWRAGSIVHGTRENPTCATVSGQPACVPLDLFGPEGNLTPEMMDFLSEDSSSSNRTSLGQLRAIVSGDFGYALPWAAQPIGFAVGTEFRKYKGEQKSDILAKTAGELGGAGGATPDVVGGYAVYEGYAELIAPLVEDKPFAESLTLEAGARYSQYEIDGADGSTEAWTWKAGGSWEPGYGVKIRGNYSKAVRAPNLAELFTPLVVGLTNLGIDPCAGSAPANNANLRAVCIAQGAPVGAIGLIANPTAAQANAQLGGNLQLDPETAKTWTLGVVYQPEFLPRFSVSVDYYNIRVTDVIANKLPGDAIGACFDNLDASSVNNPDCLIIRRNPITGGLDGDPATTPGLFLQLDNRGELFTDGVDLIANYRTDVGFGDLALSFVGNWTNNSEFNANVENPNGFFRECAGHYSVNCSFTGSIQPKLQFSQRTTLTMGKVDLSLLWRWIDKVTLEPQQIEDDALAADAANRGSNGQLLPIHPNAAAGGGFGNAAFQQCPLFDTDDYYGCMIEEEFRSISSEHYFDLTARFNATDNMTFTATVQNLFNNQPKVVGNTIGNTAFNSGNVFPSSYDALGRRYAVSAKLKF